MEVAGHYYSFKVWFVGVSREPTVLPSTTSEDVVHRWRKLDGQVYGFLLLNCHDSVLSNFICAPNDASAFCVWRLLCDLYGDARDRQLVSARECFFDCTFMISVLGDVPAAEDSGSIVLAASEELFSPIALPPISVHTSPCRDAFSGANLGVVYP